MPARIHAGISKEVHGMFPRRILREKSGGISTGTSKRNSGVISDEIYGGISAKMFEGIRGRFSESTHAKISEAIHKRFSKEVFF